MKLKIQIPKADQLYWYDKTLLGVAGVGILVSMYVYNCTCSIGNKETTNQVALFYTVVKALDYFSILMIILGLAVQKERVLQYQQWFGFVLLSCVLIVSALSFLPCSSIPESDTIKHSLLCPQYSIISWLNVLWFAVIGGVNLLLPKFLRKS